MKQDIRETTDAILKDLIERIELIFRRNSHLRDIYWIVFFAKPLKYKIDGKYALVQYIKEYYKKPDSKVAMNIIEVNNIKGTAKYKVNLPDVPFNYEALNLIPDGIQEQKTDLANAYVYE